jgi:hypothetical protein
MRRAIGATTAIWCALLVAMTITYTRLDPAELYHVSRSGTGGGLSRALVEIDYPIALVAVAVALVLAPTLSRRGRWMAVVAGALCLVTLAPGVVDESDLDARWINVIPAMGVLAIVGLGVAGLRAEAPEDEARRRFDPARVAVAAALAILSLPWLAAEAGVFLPKGLFQMRHPVIGENGVVEAAVHLGHHHGLDGVLLAVTAMVLSRVPLGHGRRAAATRAYLSLLFAYGVANLAEDAWSEQVVASGWSHWTFPSSTSPSFSIVWMLIVVATVALAYLLRWEARTGVPGDRRELRSPPTSMLQATGGRD